jgi:hypothetical protein
MIRATAIGVLLGLVACSEDMDQFRVPEVLTIMTAPGGDGCEWEWHVHSATVDSLPASSFDPSQPPPNLAEAHSQALAYVAENFGPDHGWKVVRFSQHAYGKNFDRWVYWFDFSGTMSPVEIHDPRRHVVALSDGSVVKPVQKAACRRGT